MTRRRAEPRYLAFALATWAVVSHAQGGGVHPRIGLTQAWTDNLRLDDKNKDAALITTLSPGITITRNSGSVRASVDYSLNGIAYQKTDQPSRIQNALAANVQAELIPDTFYVDVRASIGQQNASAFGQQSVPMLGAQGAMSNLANSNQHETGVLSVSPSWRGTLGGLASYDLRGDFMRTEARGTSLGDSRSKAVTMRISELNAGVVGWWASASTQEVTSSSDASNRNSNLRLGLNYRPDPDWNFSANVGTERSDYLGGSASNGVTSGASAQWTPTPRSRLSADWQRHKYGDSHTLGLEHRLARSVWRYSDMQSTTLGNTGASGGVRSNYDQFFLLFASLEPDPVKRDALVRAYLQSQGLSPDAPVVGGFLSSGPSRLRSQQLSVTLQGVRSSISAQFGRTVSGRLGSNVNQGDLANSSRIEQRSLVLMASYQLSALSGLSLNAARQDTEGDLASQSTRLSSLTASWNLRLGTSLNLLLGARHSRFEGVTPYTENGAYATLTQSF